MNSCNFIGRLTADPDVRYTQTSNTMVTQFNLAVDRPFVKEGEERQADFITIVAWNKTAEFVSKYFKKGLRVGVTGRIETGSYDDKDGKRVYTTKVIAEHVYFADSKREGEATGANPFGGVDAPFNTNATSSDFTPVTDDDLPF